QLKLSPTSPSWSEFQPKKNSLDEVKHWSENKVSDWLSGQSLGHYGLKFIEHNISGSVLLDLDYEALKAMEIKTVGERVRLATAIKGLRQECYLNTRPTRPPVVPEEPHTKFSKSTETVNTKSLLKRSNSFSRFLGRSESKKSQKSNFSTATTLANSVQSLPMDPPLPSSPKAIQKRNSLEGGIMSMEKVKQTCVKVFGEDGQTRIVNVHNANESKVIMGKVLHKFGIDESNANRFCIFVGSSTHGEARALSDDELVDICRSTDRPEKERLILRKRHMYPTHEEFKRKGTVNQRQLQLGEALQSNLSLPDMESSISSSSSRTRRQFFGERPPSEMISSNLQSFFPNHNREILETAGMNAQRLSTIRRYSSLSRSDPKINRNSVFPELVSALGVDLDNFLEEDEEDEKSVLSYLSASESSLSLEPSAMSPELPSIKVEPVEKACLAAQYKTPALPDTWMKGSLIGRGTFGDVYLGLNPFSGELMAIKQVELPVENSATEERKRSMVDALHREIELLKELEHENIVQYLGLKIDASYFSIFLEYVPGGSVAGLLASYGAFQEPLVISFVRQILKGLNYLHNKDIVHRDIKGANVLVDNKGGVKITDFGISKKLEEGEHFGDKF
ncbi:ATP binding protein, partial [Rhizopus stolonifer]